MSQEVYPFLNRAHVICSIVSRPLFTYVQEATEVIIISLPGVVHFCLQCRLSQDQGHQWIRLLLFCPFLAHDGPRHAADLAYILAPSSTSHFYPYHGCRSYRLGQVHFWQHCGYQAAAVRWTSASHMGIHE